ncbi:hypothetical protein PYW07_006484 [Mythimna separata]|uniref:Mos1 transposase HTH domain-containing protein n=1 Tax=Mythimna separata TaxID=271217 RepID=A0AAD7YUY1_MYTSE|nr:hypothetical protein PYW07_006484 [Mythimna separata]
MMTDSTMMKKIEPRAVIKFLTKQGKTQKIIHEEMVAVYQDSAPSLSTIQKWSSEFKRGRESIEDDPRAGGPICAATEENVKLVEKLVLEDARVRVKTLAKMTKLSVGTIHTILHERLNLSKVSARWLPRMLSALQKQVRVDCCKDFLDLCGENPQSIFDRIVTGDETWVHHYDPESKQESMQWHKKGSAPPKKFKVTPSAGKLMATVFWDSKGILLIEYTKKGQSITAASYATTLRNLKEAIKEKRRGKLTAGVLLLHDNAPVHKARLAQAAVREYGFEEINHPPYSPDLAPSDYFLFPNLKKDLRGKRFSDDEELKGAINEHFSGHEEKYFSEGIEKLLSRTNKCIEMLGEYIEK